MRSLLLLLIFVQSALLFAGGTPENAVFFQPDSRKNGKLVLPHTFDGRGFFAIPCRNTGSQSVCAVMSFPAKVSGEVLSRHVSRDGKRGVELGFSGRNFYELNGAKPVIVGSSGTRKYIRVAVSGKEFEPEKGEKYLLTLSFSAGNELESYIIRLSDRLCIWQSKVKTPGITGLTPNAG
ncbi:MAG: hypothetical protein J6Q80_03025, partial [Lentisphaeria bacterium]|nr:hypothetical protein [Lentisphaeria bacterium]